MLKANIHEMFARFAAQDPEPVGELNYKNPYTLLVAVALSAQATDVGVNKATGAVEPIKYTYDACFDPSSTQV